MAIKSSMQASFGNLFDTAFAEAVRAFTGIYTGAGTWDPVEEVHIGAGPVTYTGRGVLTRYKADQIDGIRIQATDVRLVALVNEVGDRPAPEHTVAAPDLITGETRQYRVVECVTDPAGVHFQIQLRAT